MMKIRKKIDITVKTSVKESYIHRHKKSQSSFNLKYIRSQIDPAM